MRSSVRLDVVAAVARPLCHLRVQLHARKGVPGLARDLLEVPTVARADVEQAAAAGREQGVVLARAQPGSQADECRRDDPVIVVVGVVAGRIERDQLLLGRARIRPIRCTPSQATNRKRRSGTTPCSSQSSGSIGAGRQRDPPQQAQPAATSSRTGFTGSRAGIPRLYWPEPGRGQHGTVGPAHAGSGRRRTTQRSQ